MAKAFNPGDCKPARESVAGKYSGPAIVMGSGRTLWDDLARIPAKEYAYIAVNLAGCFCQRNVSHWCSLHPEYFPNWLAIVQKHPTGCTIWTHTQKQSPYTNFFWNLPNPQINGGSSGMFATLVSLELGFAPIILCGMPLDTTGHFYDPPRSNELSLKTCIKSWERNLHTFKDRVFSYSGLTRDMLGEPKRGF